MEKPAKIKVKEQKSYQFLSVEERSVIKTYCNILRKTPDSRKNMFYIVTNFGEFSQKSVFEVDEMDAEKYLGFLAKEKKRGNVQEDYCACIFLELRTFYDFIQSCGTIPNPFSGIENPFKLRDRLSVVDLPSLQEVDILLGTCKNDPVLFLCVLFAFRMALPISEIVQLEKRNFCFDESDGNMYLSAWRWVDGQKKEMLLAVPDDLIPHIQNVLELTPADYNYLFRSQKGKTYAVRSMQRLLNDAQKKLDKKIQFSELRSLCMYIMLQEKIPVQKICAYTNIRGDWLVRYEKVDRSLILDASKCVHIQIVSGT